MAAATAWVDSGAGMIPSVRANRMPASKHSVCGMAMASINPWWATAETSGATPW